MLKILKIIFFLAITLSVQTIVVGQKRNDFVSESVYSYGESYNESQKADPTIIFITSLGGSVWQAVSPLASSTKFMMTGTSRPSHLG